MRVVFVHGACVRDGAWWWRRTAAVLDAAGVPSVSPRLPSCGESGEGSGDGSGREPGHDGPGLAEDVAAVREVLAGTDEPTVVVAHSYGGIVVAEAMAGLSSVRHLVLVSSYLPEPGEALGDFGPAEPAPFLDVDLDAGTFGARPEQFADVFMQDCRDDVSAGLDRLAAQSVSVTATPVQVAAWRDVPTTYVVCADDRGTPAARQRDFARKASKVVELRTGHHPFLADPTAMAEIVLIA